MHLCCRTHGRWCAGQGYLPSFLVNFVMDPKLLEILACPRSKQPLTLGKGGQYLVCEAEGVAYPIIDGIPYLMESSAITLNSIETAPMATDSSAGGPAT